MKNVFLIAFFLSVLSLSTKNLSMVKAIEPLGPIGGGYVTISGYVRNASSNAIIPGVQLELYQGGARIGTAITNSNGYYSMDVDQSYVSCVLYAWKVDYVSQSKGVTPSRDRTVNFYLNSEVVPMPEYPTPCMDPTSYTDPSGGWSSETEAYEEGEDYAVGSTSVISLYYEEYLWDISSEDPILSVHVNIHWKSVLNDKIKVRLHWDGDSSDWVTPNSHCYWQNDTIDFTSATTWTPSKINSEDFKVEIQKITVGYNDRVLVDWVGTSVILAKFAVIVGIEEYNEWDERLYGDEDATDWYNYLTTEADFHPDNIRILGDENTAHYPKYTALATESNIKSNLEWLAAREGEIAFIFEGHGYRFIDPIDEVICAWEFDAEDGFINGNDIAEIFDDISASRMFIFLESCFSGGLINELSNAVGNKLYMTTACDLDESAYPNDTVQNGAWTNYFLEIGLNNHPYWSLESVFDLVANPYLNAMVEAGHGVITPKEEDNYSGGFCL